MIKHSDLDKLVYDKLKQMILRKEIKPDEQIIQEELAKRLGVSRTPLRRALTQLAQEHLVYRTRQGGTYVRKFSREEMVTVFEIREVLEGLACRKAVPMISEKRLVFFKGLYKEALKDAKKGDWTAYQKVDEKFHFYLVDASGIDLLQNIVKSFRILSNSYGEGLVRPPQETLAEHMGIIDALRDRDPDLSERLMREHTRKSIRVLKEEVSALGS